MVTTIQIDENLKERLDKLKIHYRETYNELISRIINSAQNEKITEESLIETIEILSDPKTLKEITEGLNEYKLGNFKTLTQIKNELK